MNDTDTIKGIFSFDEGQLGVSILEANRLLLEARSEAYQLKAKMRSKLAFHAIKLRKRVRLNALMSAQNESQEILLNKLFELEERHASNLANCEAQCIELLCSIAEKVIGDEISTRPATLADRLKREIATLNMNRSLLVKVNQQDYEIIKNNNIGHQCKLQIDQSVEVNTARLQTDCGTVTINWKEHLAQIVDKIREIKARELV